MLNLESTNNIKDKFPILNSSLVYLDSAATTQKPKEVIDTISNYYKEINSNPHRGSYTISVLSTKAYEKAREKVKKFINSDYLEEVIFTKGSTEALNLIAYSYGLNNINEGDEILVSISEHHSNLIPWQQIAKIKKANLKYFYINSNYKNDLDHIKSKITAKTKLVCIAHVSNVIGMINPVKEITKLAHEVGALVVVDAAQSIAHLKVDVKNMDCDFLVFSGHKMFAPMGIGVLYGKKNILDKMPPFLFGGDMIEYVYEQETTFAKLPSKFEGGTQNIEGAIGLAKAIDFIEDIGIDNIRNHEISLLKYAFKELSKLEYVKILSPMDDMVSGAISFTVDSIHPHDLATILDSKGICVRAGNHCAQPLMRYLNINSTLRASFSIYNTKEDIDKLIEGLKYGRRLFGYGS